MKNIKKFLIDLQEMQISPPENPEQIKLYLKGDRIITFFSWKIFGIKLVNGKVTFSFKFNEVEASKYVDQEALFLKLIRSSGIKYRYLKIIPDELPEKFWGCKYSVEINNYISQLKSYFQKIEPVVEILKLTDFLKNKENNGIYEKVFQNVDQSFNSQCQSSLVSPEKFLKEVKLRSTYYTSKPLSRKKSKELARKAFALFAAETSLLFKLQQENTLPNLILLAGQRSVDTYKYEFDKYLIDRPVLPKLFVI